jgi:hypothetical protein
MRGLKQALLDEYGAFADKRIKRIDRGHIFAVDDRGPGDIGADGNLFSYFCLVFADVISDVAVDVSLDRNLPIGSEVTEWIKRHNGTFSESHGNAHLQFRVIRGSQHILSELAQAIRAIVAPGAPRYAVNNYKYVCPRTAASLERLKAALDRAWS